LIEICSEKMTSLFHRSFAPSAKNWNFALGPVETMLCMGVWVAHALAAFCIAVSVSHRREIDAWLHHWNSPSE
jgi:hypothetical protein